MLRNCGMRKIDLIGVALLLLLAGLVHGSYRSGAQWTDALKSVSTEPWKKHYVTKETLISDDENLIVNTKFGPIQGTYAPPELGMKAQDYPYEEQQQNWVRAFLGIPFAKPPVGSRRFQYATRWNETWQDAFGKEILRADKFGPQCLQFIAFPLKNLNEDCLYMNVYIPPAAKVNKDKKLPVLFWYFGGAWVFGNGGVGTVEDKNLYAGNHLLQDNSFILVTANFRIGALGYYTGHNDKGNAGIDDSIAALEFIYENIEQFGGDKENINIAGMSSGAYNALLLAAKHKRPPVKRVFLMSSPMSLKTMPLNDARAKSAAFATKAGCSYDDLECLQKVHPVKLMLSDLDGLGINQKDPLRAPFKWVPTTDEDSQIASPSDLDITRLKDVEVFIGVSEHEAGLFFAFFEFVQGGSLVWLHGERSIWDTMYDWGAALIDLVLRRSQFHGKSLNAAERLYVNSVRSLFGEDSNIVLEKYPPKKTVKDNKEILLNLFTDYIFVCSNRKLIKRLNKIGSTVYVYEQFIGPSSLWPFGKGYMDEYPAAHGLDLMFLFNFFPKLDKVNDGPMAKIYSTMVNDFISGKYSRKENLKFEQTTQDYSSQFEPKITLEPYSIESQNVLTLGKNYRNESIVTSGLHEEICDFWESKWDL